MKPHSGADDHRPPSNARPDPPVVRQENFSRFLQASGLTVGDISPTKVTATLRLGPDHHTPWGIVHGGVYATAAESVASVGASAAAGSGMYAVGLNNSTDFLRPTVSAELQVEGTAVHQGRTQQLWQVTIRRPDGKEVARSQVRLQNVPLPQAGPAAGGSPEEAGPSGPHAA